MHSSDYYVDYWLYYHHIDSQPAPQNLLSSFFFLHSTTMMQSCLYKIFFAILAIAGLVQAFSPTCVANPSKQIDSSLAMFGGKKPADKKPKKGAEDPFAGRGSRITIREDEDNAMWIDEPGDVKKGKGKKGK
jgi:hypothetical protein